MTDKHTPIMGFWRTWGLSVGVMVGSGVFMLPTVLAPHGKYALYSWLITGGGTVALAFSLAFIAKRVTKPGGPYAYTRAGFGDFAGFLMAWGYWISIWVSVAAITVAFIGYLGAFFPILRSSPNGSLAVGLGLIWSLVLLNCRSVNASSLFQLVSSLAKFLPLLFLALFGLMNVDSANYASMAQPKDSVSSLSAASALTMWAFIGFEAATIPAGEIKDPARTIPRALVTSVLAVAVLYMAVTVAAFGLLPAEALMRSTAPLSDAAAVLVGPYGAAVVVIVALVATGSGVNANLFAAGQMPMAAALDGLFPKVFGRLSAEGIPVAAFVIGGILASAALALNFAAGLIAAFHFLILLATISALIPVTLSVAAAWQFSLRDKSRRASEKIGEGAVMAIGFGYALWAIAGSGQESVYWGFLLLLLGAPVYIWITSDREQDKP